MSEKKETNTLAFTILRKRIFSVERQKLNGVRLYFSSRPVTNKKYMYNMCKRTRNPFFVSQLISSCFQILLLFVQFIYFFIISTNLWFSTCEKWRKKRSSTKNVTPKNVAKMHANKCKHQPNKRDYGNTANRCEQKKSFTLFFRRNTVKIIYNLLTSSPYRIHYNRYV